MQRPVLIAIAGGVLIAVVAVVWFAMRGSGPPEVQTVEAVPASLSYHGGTTVVTALLAGGDAQGVTVRLLDEQEREVAQAAAEPDGESWSAQVTLPPNLNAEGSAVTYTAYVAALDDRGRSSAAVTATVNVAAPELPPSPPL